MLNLPKRSIYSKHRVLFIWAGIVVEVVLLAALAVLAIVVFGAIYYRVTEDPKFCGSLCHNMSASYESYKSSAHSGVRCAECHSEPGLKGTLKAVTVDAAREIYIYMEGEDFYDMDELHPKIQDESCLRHECHQAERLIEQKSVSMDGKVFSHRSHLSVLSSQAHDGDDPTVAEMLGTSPALNCTSCHSQSKKRHMVVNPQPCFICHLDSGSAAVPLEKCAKCHEAVKKPLDSDLAHELHVGPQRARCMDCHELEEVESGELKLCQMCHSAQDTMYQGSVKFVAEKMPSPKAETVDCNACHVSAHISEVETLDEMKKMCVECHEAGYDEMVDGWQEMIRDEVKEAEELLSDVAKLLKVSEDKPQKKEASSLSKEARERLVFVQKDGSSGAHNVDLADELLTDAIEKLTKCQELLK